ncbi:MAG: phosphomethylpyrimidine synthase ThiC [Proteobacteria bacterium]|nr:phosphomethylpyrimidine synthase ThiC [Pseudomonadota bacterium]MBU1738261.1 phosphomethylpyrimidine synthase ThiC [Pseudomonadota bacterium]
MSIREDAINGTVTPLFEACATNEGFALKDLMAGVAAGTIAIPKNNHHDFERIMAIGKGVSTKVNANIGASKDYPEIGQELQKLCVCLKAGADTVMDLSMGDNLNEVRREILKSCPIPLGTVPIYQSIAEVVEKQKKQIGEVTVDQIFNTIEQQAIDGVDFMTLHCGITRSTLERVRNHERIIGVVSRGGSFTIEWMSYNNKENPLYERFDDLLAILKEHEVTLSLGDGIRPGCLADATDRGQVQELIHLGELTQRAWEAGVQVIIEGPGHMPMNQIEANILLQKRLCHNAPFYVLGPLVTDIAPGYDHITGAIGGAIAAAAGADYLCYVTPAEHLKLPSADDVRDGVIASRIAAHAADIAKGLPGALDKDIAMAKCRNNLDWKGQIDLSMDPEKARRYRDEGGSYKGDACSMCGSYCAIKVYKRATSPKRLNN